MSKKQASVEFCSVFACTVPLQRFFSFSRSNGRKQVNSLVCVFLLLAFGVLRREKMLFSLSWEGQKNGVFQGIKRLFRTSQHGGSGDDRVDSSPLVYPLCEREGCCSGPLWNAFALP